MLAFLDYDLGRSLWLQVRTLAYREDRATILDSSVDAERGSKGRYSYGIKVRYTFDLGSSNFVSDRYAWQATRSSDSEWTHAAVAQNTRGTKVPVYYDPLNPGNSVLRRGVDGSDLMVLLFLTPFHAIGLGLLSAAFFAFFGNGVPRVKSEPGGRKRVDVRDVGPWTAFLVAIGLSSFCGIFLTAIPFGFHPPIWYVTAIWTLCLTLAFYAGITTALKMLRGEYHLIVDPHAGTLSLPPMHAREHRRDLPFQEIRDVHLRESERQSRRGRKSYRYEVILDSARGEEYVVCKPSSRQEGERWVEWLRLTLGQTASTY